MKLACVCYIVCRGIEIVDRGFREIVIYQFAKGIPHAGLCHTIRSSGIIRGRRAGGGGCKQGYHGDAQNTENQDDNNEVNQDRAGLEAL
jgi:hypothetical protein